MGVYKIYIPCLSLIITLFIDLKLTHTYLLLPTTLFNCLPFCNIILHRTWLEECCLYFPFSSHKNSSNWFLSGHLFCVYLSVLVWRNYQENALVPMIACVSLVCLSAFKKLSTLTNKSAA